MRGVINTGLFDKIFGKKKADTVGNQGSAFQTLTAYTPVFTSRYGEIYESELVRSAIDRKATHTSKLKVDITGTANPKLTRFLKRTPNDYQTWSQFLYRLRTIYEVQNNAFIIPIFDALGDVTGLFPVLPSRCELVEWQDTIYLRYTFSNSKKAAIEFEKCGVLTKHQYLDDFFGTQNNVLNHTLDLIEIQNQGIEEGVKSAATYRFMATAGNLTFGDDLRKEKNRFNTENLSGEGGGLLLFPSTYTNIQQINSKPFVVDAEQMKIIQTNVYNYFGVNEDILQNKAFGDAWAAFYEGEIEPFAIQLSDVLTKLLFSPKEQAFGASIIFTANRLQYLTNSEKLATSTDLLDRGILTINQALDIWNLPNIGPEGDERIIRGEYYNASVKINETSEEEDNGV